MMSHHGKNIRSVIYGGLLAMMILGGIISQVYAADITTEPLIVPLSTINLLKNGAFNLGSMTEVISPAGYLGDSPGCGTTAADSWTCWNVHYPHGDETPLPTDELITVLEPSTLVADGKMIHVTTNGTNNGLVQVFKAYDTGPEKAYACAWIKIVSGKVGMGIGNGGNTGANVVLSKTGSWERVEVSNGVSPANEFIIYSIDGGAEFYVEFASVTRDRLASCTPK